MSAEESEPYLAVLQAAYDYEPQSEDEIAIKENQLVFLLERTDDDWWKVKPKGETPEEETVAGLVPAAYVEQAPHTSYVKALYDYEPAAPGELRIQEDQILLAFSVPGEEEWLLVQYHDKEDHHEGPRAGYVPANYVEETTEDSPSSAAPAAPQIVVPDSPPRPAAPYTDPTELVAASHRKSASLSAQDPIQTWGISEVDKKGKKKKGTLGVGNGAVFFASEADKTPVQKWQTSCITAMRIDKSKHLYITLSPPAPAEQVELHFNAGGRDTADAILSKLESSRALSQADSFTSVTSAVHTNGDAVTRSPGKKGATVHFSEAGPAIIPPREATPTEEVEDDESEGLALHADGANEGALLHHGEDAADRVVDEAAGEEDIEGGLEEAVALYEFEAQGADELSVAEEERVWIVERDAEGEWWKCRNAQGQEGVVPASYVEPAGRSSVPPSPVGGASAGVSEPEPEPEEPEEDDTAAREAEERARAEREQEERERARKKAAADRAMAAEAEAKRKARERDRVREHDRAEREEREAREAREKKERRDRDNREHAKQNGSTSGRSSSDRRGPPPADKVRTWHDRTGQFRVDAALLAYKDGKIRLHKVNGVVIEVPSEKMSVEDMRYIEKETQARRTAARPVRDEEDDVPLAVHRGSLQSQPKSAETRARELQAARKKVPTIDWFDFFLTAGCDLDDCTRYASAFERDKIDETLLPDITEGTMRSLGLREGDIIRVNKEIEKRYPGSKDKGKSATPTPSPPDTKEGEVDLLSGEPAKKAPSLFAGPGGALKTARRRGRPQPSKSLPPSSVDLNAITSASDQIQRAVTPQSQSPGTTTSPVQVPSRTGSAAAVVSGFDDDAWTPRPSSTKPTATAATPPVSEPRAPSAPPAPAPPLAPPAPPAPAAPVQAQPTGLAKTTESDIFDQLARLSQLRVQSPPVNSAPSRSPAIASPPPASYNSGLGMGTSPVPIGQHLQAQQTGVLPPPSPANSMNGPRGPYAPVPANQSLLQPLIPTTTGFNGFVPTRPGASPFQPQQQQMPPQQPSFLGPQPTGFQQQPQQQFLAPQVTGFQPSLAPQVTGFQPQGSLLSQQTGMPGGFGNFGLSAGAPPVPPLPSFQNTNNSFGQLQPNPTGFNPGFGQPPSAQPPTNNTSPANIFAQMKAGTFGNDAAPQNPNKYDALRTNPTPLTAQATGWGGFPGAYPGQQF